MQHGRKMNRIFLLSSAVFLLPCESELIFIYCVPRILISSLRELVSCTRKIQKSDWLYFILLTTDGKCLQNITHLLLAKIAVMLVTTSYKSSFDRRCSISAIIFDQCSLNREGFKLSHLFTISPVQKLVANC